MKETNTITVMCLHHCLIIKDDDKRSVIPKTLAIRELFPTGKAPRREKEQGGKSTVTQGKQAGLLRVCSAGTPSEILGNNWYRRQNLNHIFNSYTQNIPHFQRETRHQEQPSNTLYRRGG